MPLCLPWLLSSPAQSRRPDARRPDDHEHAPIQHIIMIMQENRSFDNYFGTFPGANGIPQRRNRAGADCSRAGLRQ